MKKNATAFPRKSESRGFEQQPKVWLDSRLTAGQFILNLPQGGNDGVANYVRIKRELPSCLSQCRMHLAHRLLFDLADAFSRHFELGS